MGLFLATLLAGALRFAFLGSVPISLYCDEALHGYEAWSLLTTGRDRRGVLLPFVFDVFGIGWSEPLYIYLTVPAVALFGVTPFAARFMAALAGTLAVPAAGLMTESLLAPDRPASPRDMRFARMAGLASAFAMALSPWPFHFSRVGFQAALLPLLLGAGFWLCARGTRQGSPRWNLPAGVAILALTLYTYPVPRVALPLLAAGFAWTHRRRLAALGRPALAAAAVLAAMAIPIAVFSLSERGLHRFTNLSVMTLPQADLSAKAAIAASNYVSYFSPRFLLQEGDPNPRHSVRVFGMLHPHDVVLVVIGIYFCLKARSPGARFLLWWLAAFPVAAALTVDPRHAVRGIVALPGLHALAGAGAAFVAEWLRGRAAASPGTVVKRTVAAIAALAAVVPVCRYFHHYFTAWPVQSAQAFQYGLKETYEWVETARAGHDSIYVTRNEDEPWIHLVFYKPIPPSEYQAHQLTGTPYLFGEKVFYKGDRIPGRLNPIFVLKPFEVPEKGVTPRQVIRYPDGSPAFVIAW